MYVSVCKRVCVCVCNCVCVTVCVAPRLGKHGAELSLARTKTGKRGQRERVLWFSGSQDVLS